MTQYPRKLISPLNTAVWPVTTGISLGIKNTEFDQAFWQDMNVMLKEQPEPHIKIRKLPKQV